MLCLTRRVGESVRIGGEIVVTVLESSAGRVRLGIEAPRFVPVARSELDEREEEEFEDAADLRW